MKKTLLLFSLLIGVSLFTSKVYAYEPANYKWNITPSYFQTFGANKIVGFDENHLGAGFSLEGTYKLNPNIEVGAYASISSFERCYPFLDYNNFKVNGTIDFMSVNVLAVANYNYRTSRFVELSGGLGAGMMFAEKGSDISINPLVEKSCNSLVLMPRIGMKVRNHLKFSLGYKWQETANKYAFISIGYTFGIKKF